MGNGFLPERRRRINSCPVKNDSTLIQQQQKQQWLLAVSQQDPACSKGLRGMFLKTPVAMTEKRKYETPQQQRVRQKTEDMFTSSSHPGWLEYDIPLTNQGIQDSKDSLRYFTLYIWIFMSNCSFWLFSSKKKHYTMTCEHLFNCKNVILSISDLFGKKQPIWAFLVICYTRLIT